MSDVLERQRVVTGHDQVAEQSEDDGEDDLVDGKRAQVRDDVAISVACQSVLQDPQSDREQRQDDDRFEKRSDPLQTIEHNGDSNVRLPVPGSRLPGRPSGNRQLATGNRMLT